VPKPMPIESEAARLQSALLDPRTAYSMPLWRRVVCTVRRYLS
jgi:hypothetical protein